MSMTGRQFKLRDGYPDKRLCWWDGREFIRHRGQCVVGSKKVKRKKKKKKRKRKWFHLWPSTRRPICCCPFHEGINRVACKIFFPTKYVVYEYLSQTEESTFKWANCILMEIRIPWASIYWNIRLNFACLYIFTKVAEIETARNLNIIETIGIRGSVFSKLKGFQQ